MLYWLFSLYLLLSVLVVWGAAASGGNPNHGGSWTAALIGLVIGQPWIAPIAKLLHPQGDLSLYSLGASCAINVVLFALYLLYRARRV